jgi:hypothetical protein
MKGEDESIVRFEFFVNSGSYLSIKSLAWCLLENGEGIRYAILILRFLQLRSKFSWSLSNLVALLRMSLFTHRDLWTWLNYPFQTDPIPYEPEQLCMNWG